jgi:type IV pilus assembly protein PilA
VFFVVKKNKKIVSGWLSREIVCVLVKLFLKGKKIMRSRKGFTLIELMVVVVIVAVLAAIIVPLLTSRINKAKWSEARAAMAQISTALRAYAVENEALTATIGSGGLGFKANELDGKYFDQDDYTILAGGTYNADGTLTYTIRATASRSGAPTGGPLNMVCTLNLVTWNPADL